MHRLTVGEVAKRAAVHIETLRYYERQGLVARPPRSRSNYRLYPEETVRRVQFIKRAQELGFSLKEISAPWRVIVGLGRRPASEARSLERYL